jgi:hypothetical protein
MRTNRLTNTLFIILLVAASPLFRTVTAFGSVSRQQELTETDRAFALLELVKETDNFVSNLSDIYSIDFPIGITANDSKEAENYAIVIPEMYIIDGEPRITAYMAFKIPGTTERVAFKGENIPLSFAGGLSGISTLELVGDNAIPLGRALTMILRGNGATNVKWDCNGFLEMEVTADLLFDNSLFVPENIDGTIREGELRSSFHTVVNDWNNLMVGVSVEPFQIRGLDGFGFNILNAVIDMSDFRNPSGIMFPSNYITEYLIEGNPNIWRGLYILQAEIRFPPWFSQTGETNRLSIHARDMFIDELGFSGQIGATELMSIDQGDLNGWGFSVENFDLLIETNSLVAAGFSGMLAVPQLGENSLLHYQASIGLDASYSFMVNNVGALEMDMWGANLEIANNSLMAIELIDNKFIPTLLLNGRLSIDAPVDNNDPASSRLELTGLEFRDMLITTEAPYFDIGYLSFGNQQNSFALFPISITDVGFDSESGRRGITVGATVNFTDEKNGGFGGAGLFTVWGRNDNGKWIYDGTEVGGIMVDIDKGEAFRLYGEVNFISGDETYGNGFKGNVDANFAGFGMRSTALFGNVGGNRYFYADALMATTAGLPVGPIAIYGFGGGAYYHMRPSLPDNPSVSAIGRTASGIFYTPDASAGLGLKASVRLGLTANANTFNGDAELGVDFNAGGGINKIAFRGNAYFATSNFSCNTTDILQNARHILAVTGGGVKIPRNEERSALVGDVEINYDFPAKSFHSSFNVYANIAGGVITGVGPNGLAGSGVMHFSPGEWYLLLGTPSNPNGIKVVNIATFQNYFMAGNDVPSIPSPPVTVTNSLREHGLNYSFAQNGLELANGTGLAFGSKFSVNTGERNFLIFYGQFGCDIGFDIMMKNYRGTVCQGGTALGINGWYAQGQAYSWVKANVGVKIGLPFYSGTYEIFDMELATLMRVKAPNPVWLKGNVGGHYALLNGLIKGNCSFDFEIGEQCVPTTTAELGEMMVITDLQPGEAEEEVGVYTTPQIIFNMPVGENIAIDDFGGGKRVFRTRLDNFSIEDENGTTIPGIIEWNSEKDVASLNPHDLLPGKTMLKVRATATFEELKGGSWIPATNKGKALTETRETMFTTGERPKTVSPENVAYSYPGMNALNYYPGESGQGYVKLKNGQDYLFQPSEGWRQGCRLVNVTTGTTQEIGFKYDNAATTIQFSLPTNMTGNNVYRIEIVNIPAVSGSIDNNVINDSEIVALGDENYNTEVEILNRYAEGEREEFEESVIFTMEFRSGANMSFSEKIDEAKTGSLFKRENQYFSNRVDGELFDFYELGAINANKMVTAEPALDKTTWYTTFFKPLISMSDADMMRIGVSPFKVEASTVVLRTINSRDILSDNEAESGIVGLTSGTLSVNNYLMGKCASYYYHVKSRVANLYSTNPRLVSEDLMRILNSTYYWPDSGSYPIRLSYTLPGSDKPISVTDMELVLR